ncbi:hypothetical protein F4604DRAFT_560465 [Suillus subluteus]|nr:hypothetical protein F4604DRAFT_560465 [Suillus subluteus]
MSKLELIYQQLCSLPASELLSIHPNDLAASGFQLPGSWKGWWEWATSIDDEHTPCFPRWMSVLHYYSTTPDDQQTGNQIPSNKSLVGLFYDDQRMQTACSSCDRSRPI